MILFLLFFFFLAPSPKVPLDPAGYGKQRQGPEPSFLSFRIWVLCQKDTLENKARNPARIEDSCQQIRFYLQQKRYDKNNGTYQKEHLYSLHRYQVCQIHIIPFFMIQKNPADAMYLYRCSKKHNGIMSKARNTAKIQK